MNEEAFWDRLERRVCDELTGMDDTALRRFWCDGFVAEQFLLALEPSHVTGYAWMGTGPRQQERWTFILPSELCEIESRGAVVVAAAARGCH
jgi:hypothetical protein